MSNFDGARDLRIVPPCICGDMMELDDDGWYCEECGVLIAFGNDGENAAFVESKEVNDHRMIVSQRAFVHISDHEEWYPAVVSWDIFNFEMRVHLHSEKKKVILNVIGLNVDQSSQYWE